MILLAGAAVANAEPADQAGRIRAAMEASLQQQRASVERQVAALRARETAPPPQAVAAPEAPDASCDPVPQEQIGAVVAEISEREGLTPDLLRAVIEKESSYLPCAVSPKGAQGLMQLMPATAASLGVDDPFDPRQNVDGGARFLKALLERYRGKLDLALAAYNAGPGRVDSAGGIPKIPETLDYVSDILGKLRASPTY